MWERVETGWYRRIANGYEVNIIRYVEGWKGDIETPAGNHVTVSPRPSLKEAKELAAIKVREYHRISNP
jgi:hypothetical protein